MIRSCWELTESESSKAIQEFADKVELVPVSLPHHPSINHDCIIDIPADWKGGRNAANDVSSLTDSSPVVAQIPLG